MLGCSTSQVEGPVARYAYESHFVPGSSSVSYGAQINRHLLIRDLVDEVGSLTRSVAEGSVPAEAGEVRRHLVFYLDYDGLATPERAHRLHTSPPALQSRYAEISLRDLRSKIAGNDGGSWKDFAAEGFVGFSAAGVTSPEDLVLHWISLLDSQAEARHLGRVDLDPAGEAITELHLTAEGHDLQALLEGFLLGAVPFSQALDDTLDDDRAERGLLSNNRWAAEDKDYSALEHSWDESFASFGAARDYLDHQGRARDLNFDQRINLEREYTWGHAAWALELAPEQAQIIWEAFLAGRGLITEHLSRVDPSETAPIADGGVSDGGVSDGGAGESEAAAEVDPDLLAALQSTRDRIGLAWESIIAAKVVQALDQTVAAQGGGFAEHARAWSTMKASALAFQFNPRSALSETDFARLHTLLGAAPALIASEQPARKTALAEARSLLSETYSLP